MTEFLVVVDHYRVLRSVHCVDNSGQGMDSGPAPRRVPGVFVSLALSVLAWALNSSFPLLFAGWRNACCILVNGSPLFEDQCGRPKKLHDYVCLPETNVAGPIPPIWRGHQRRYRADPQARQKQFCQAAAHKQTG